MNLDSGDAPILVALQTPGGMHAAASRCQEIAAEFGPGGAKRDGPNRLLAASQKAQPHMMASDDFGISDE